MAVVREPKQARSREAWERVLEVGRQLIEEGGVPALTITEVCRRSGINAPSLYARVDGRAGLFAAVYERGMAEVRATEERVLLPLPRPDATTGEQAAEAAEAVAEVFLVHGRLLRSVITQAESDPQLLERGAEESRRMMRRAADAIHVDPTVALEIAQTLYAECVLRTMYGAGFLTGTAETEPAFRARLARTAVARALAG
ncbi:MAG TPA: TetR family transcriptional regulator [Amnibacterium sp.]|uniref:TetR/AcrR family transcriptional regulator n=1 Tax=Amnibacterium sp. TaxID=1872496 RepID=UPI002F928652